MYPNSLGDEPEKTILVAVHLSEETEEEFNYSIEELERLVATAGGIVCACIVQKRESPDPATFIGQGKLEEIRNYLQENPEITVVVFDNDLNPRQARNLDNFLNMKTLDRTEVILDIFAARAQTKESQLEIELAQLEYLMPRLTKMWTHLERQQAGGMGTRGPGETQLETDKRLIRNRAAALRKKIKEVEKHRELLRCGRKRKGNKIVSIVGYTNAGKSTLLRKLSGKDIYVEDKLFATLDPLIRKVYLPEIKQEVLFSDTVGFIKKLPHHLVTSFKSTLEEVVGADLILHVVDISAPDYERQIEAVYDVLDELDVLEKKIITVFNKIDIASDIDISLLEDIYAPFVVVSAIDGQGIDQLLALIVKNLVGY